MPCKTPTTASDCHDGIENLRDGALWIVQYKTKVKRAIELTGELAALIELIKARPRQRLSAWLAYSTDRGHAEWGA